MSAPHDRSADERLLDGVRALLDEDARRDAASGARPPAGAGAIAIEHEDVLELTPSMLARPPATRPPATPPMEPAMQTTDPDGREGAGEGGHAAAPRAVETLVGPETAARSQTALGSLREAMRGQRQGASIHRGGPTLEEMLREEMRPMIREWIDANLPAIVERAVRTEVERLVGREAD